MQSCCKYWFGNIHQPHGKCRVGWRCKSMDRPQFIQGKLKLFSIVCLCLNPIGKSPLLGHRRSPQRPQQPLWCWLWQVHCLGNSRWNWAPARLWTLDQSAVGRWVPSGGGGKEMGEKWDTAQTVKYQHIIRSVLINGEDVTYSWNSYVNVNTD